MQAITVTREAVCGADDQTGRLTLAVPIPGTAPFSALVDAVLAQRFLQFSSSHASITGRACGVPVVRVHDTGVRPRVDFLVPPHTPVQHCVPQGLLQFGWD